MAWGDKAAEQYEKDQPSELVLPDSNTEEDWPLSGWCGEEQPHYSHGDCEGVC
jgi:hypothetical protein